jgi:hypothetical protein
VNVQVNSILLSIALASCAAAGAALAEEVEVDWVEAYDAIQNAHSTDYLLECWAEQWPDGVAPFEGPDAATESELKRAIRSTRQHCELQIEVRLDQIRIDLARTGMEPPGDFEATALRQLESELDEMFGEYWSRL